MLAVGFVGFNLVSGAKGYAVTSPSMKDTLNVGDVVFVKSVGFEELKVGDIITVASSDGKSFFTHRVVEINSENKTVNTRGDANGADDPMPTEAQRIVGRVWYSVPLLGFITIGFGYVSRSAGLLILALVAVVLVVLNSILTKSEKRRGESDE